MNCSFPKSEYTECFTNTCAVLCLVAQSCPTLWDPMNCSPPGFSVDGILQSRILEWIAILFSSGSSQPRDRPRSPADSLPFELQEVLQLSDSPLFLLLHNKKMLTYLRPHLHPHAAKKYISATKDLFRMHSA